MTAEIINTPTIRGVEIQLHMPTDVAGVLGGVLTPSIGDVWYWIAYWIIG
jgi:hypothetical protein